MPSTNFKLFDENKANMMSDQEYDQFQQRLNGVQTGVASSALHNKTMYQLSLMCYAIAQTMVVNGKDANDTANVSDFVNSLSSTLLQKVADKASVEEALAGLVQDKWISPATAKSIADQLQGNIEQQLQQKQNKVIEVSTAEALGLGPGATVDEAFVEVKSHATEEVGDIKITRRTNLGEKYLLCNGDLVSKEEYPALIDTCSMDLFNRWAALSVKGVGGSVIDIKAYAPKFAVLYTDGTVDYTEDNGVTWQKISTGLSAVQGIAYDGTNWGIGYISSSYPYLAYTSDLASANFTTIQVTSTYQASAMKVAASPDGAWAIATVTGSDVYFYAADTITGTFQRDSESGGNNSRSYYGIYFVEDRFIGWSHVSRNPNVVTYKKGGTWIRGTVTMGNSGSNIFIVGAIKVNAKYYLCGRYAASSSVQITSIAEVEVSTSSLTSTYYLSSVNLNPRCIIYENSKFIIFAADGGVYEINDLVANFDITQIGTLDFQLTSEYGQMMVTNDSAIGCDSQTGAAVFLYTIGALLLPTITIDDAYVYIRAKE